jgi:hypothetical protein
MRVATVLCVVASTLLVRCGRCGGPPRWPEDLTVGLDQVEISRLDDPSQLRTVRAVLTDGGVWLLAPPLRGEADSEAIERLRLSLQAPPLVSASHQVPADAGQPVSQLTLHSGAAEWSLTAHRSVPGEPMAVEISGVGWFAISSPELGGRLPDPSELLPRALWGSARGQLIRVAVEGSVRYQVARAGGHASWRDVDGGRPPFEIEEEEEEEEGDALNGAFAGREIIQHLAGPLEGVESTARVCTPKECRTFQLARRPRDGGVAYLAFEPSIGTVELRPDTWCIVALARPVP